jgi:murein DD-endopeptidase MepM/ murein hydrolase activator NlpD
VSQGEIVGLTGMTGNASAPHLHFEIRSGGPNGAKVNPYPTLNSAGC